MGTGDAGRWVCLTEGPQETQEDQTQSQGLGLTSEAQAMALAR